MSDELVDATSSNGTSKPRSVGRQLAQARGTAGLSVDEVSARTRIRATVVRAIEADDYSPSGGDIYARGHIRSIAAALGADSRPLIAQFDAERRPAGPDVTEVFERDTSYAIRERRGGPNWTAVMAVALVAVLGLIGFQVFRTSNDAPRQKTTVAQPSATPTTTVTPSPSASPTETNIAQGPRSEVVLQVRVVPGRRAWVSISDPNGEVYQGILASGQTKTFRDKRQLQLLVGDAAAVELTVNGNDLGVLGGTGQVVRRTFGPGDVGAGG